MRNKYKISCRLILVIIFLFLVTKDILIVRAEEEVSREQLLQKSRQYFQEGERFYNQGDYPRADEEFKKAQELLEGLKHDQTLVVTEYEKEESSLIENEAKETGLADYDVYLESAMGFAKNGDSERAISYYLRAIALAADKSNLYYNLAIEYLKTKQFNQAAEELNKVIQLDPKDKDAFYNLGVLYENYLGDLERARLYYKRYIKLAPHAVDVKNVKSWIRRIDKEIKLERKKRERQKGLLRDDR